MFQCTKHAWCGVWHRSDNNSLDSIWKFRAFRPFNHKLARVLKPKLLKPRKINRFQFSHILPSFQLLQNITEISIYICYVISSVYQSLTQFLYHFAGVHRPGEVLLRCSCREKLAVFTEIGSHQHISPDCSYLRLVSHIFGFIFRKEEESWCHHTG